MAVIGLVLVVVVLLFPSQPSVQSYKPDTTTEASRPPLPSPSASVASPHDDGAADPVTAPKGADYRGLALFAAQEIYTWDTRSSSYSEVYSRLRGLWTLLPDGSNPLTVLVQEFEATGITAGTFTTLAGQEAYRIGTAESVACDGELAKVRDYPAPWLGLHVCTVKVNVVDRTARGENAYIAPVSVMVNCPPAPTAPDDRCAMVGFYATPSRIVY
ncbi:hypothetical protein [Arthrobacter sp. HS15c]|uniref:hypothetical protein n=1 Tax=Arthrobacter sp. HS15c TaxID=3230279 RepID=UPI003464EA8F